MFCPNCGTQVVSGAKFCPNCGNLIPGAAPVIPEPEVKFEEPVAPVIPEPAVKFEEPVAPVIPEPTVKFEEPAAPANPNPIFKIEEPAVPEWQTQAGVPLDAAPFAAPVPAAPEVPEEKVPAKEVSTGKFIGLFLLFMLPVIGLISLIIFSKSKNANVRNFSRMCFIPHIVFMLLLIAAAVIGLLMYYCVDEIRLYSGIDSFWDAVKYAFEEMF